MVSYTCDNCKKTFTKKHNYTIHINRKNKCESNKQSPHESKSGHTIVQCKSESSPVEKVIKRPTCSDCGKEFNNSSNLSRHKKGRCKGSKPIQIEPDKVAEIMTIVTELKQENALLKKEITEMKSAKPSSKNTISGDVVIGNKSGDTNNIINIMAFSSNDWESFVTEEACKKILKTGFKAVPNLVGHVHLNKDFPALQNCYIANFRGKHAKTHDGESWKLVEMSDIIEKLREDKQDYLELKFGEYRKSLDDVTVKRFDKFLVEKDTDIVINQQKEDIKMLLYNDGITLKKAKNISKK
jgi:DNA-directed RNA polymerase subunit RPC12/RpoP